LNLRIVFDKTQTARIATMDNMINITLFDRDGVKHELEGPTDMNMNLMELCKAYELPVKGTCGGMALCSTCHVYVLSDHDLPEISEDEENILDQAFFVKDNSRLGCQLHLHDELEGLTVQLAPESEN
jgi:ferredoxin-2, mitochondrial